MSKNRIEKNKQQETTTKVFLIVSRTPFSFLELVPVLRQFLLLARANSAKAVLH
jgi:hypothetical protein